MPTTTKGKSDKRKRVENTTNQVVHLKLEPERHGVEVEQPIDWQQQFSLPFAKSYKA